MKPQPRQPPLVTCATYSHFHRDTFGPSYNIYTHQYFMGTCTLGLTPHSPIKQFANKPHHCKHYVKNLHPPQ